MTTEQQQAFEAALAPDDYDFKKDADGTYSAVATRIAYRGWQAAIEWHKQHMQSPEMVERVENAMYDGAIPLHKVRELAEKDGYMVAKGVVKQSHKKAKAAIAAITEG